MAGLDDTDPEAERVPLELMRQATPSRRLARRQPEADERELRVRFVELHYGPELAREVRSFLDSVAR